MTTEEEQTERGGNTLSLRRASLTGLDVRGGGDEGWGVAIVKRIVVLRGGGKGGRKKGTVMEEPRRMIDCVERGKGKWRRKRWWSLVG